MKVILQCDEQLELPINSDTAQTQFKMFSLDLNSGTGKYNFECLQL